MLLFDPATGRVHWLNGTAALIWELIDGEIGLEEISRLVSVGFGLPDEEARVSVKTIVDGLVAQSLLGDPLPSQTESRGMEGQDGDPQFEPVPPNP